mgnify:CR=1 FL=1
MTHPIPTHHTGPGLVDLQINGYAGLDFNGDPSRWTEAAWRDVRTKLRRRGVVAALPTLVTDSPEHLLARARRYGELVESDDDLSAAFPLLHIEGPFISPIDGPRGAHPLMHCTTPAEVPDLVDRLNEAACGRVGLVTLAPEVDGAIDLIGHLVRDHIAVGLGHTMATADEINRAVEAGAAMSTHLGNGSHPRLPRLDNYMQTQLADDRLFASFIADGHHMPFTTLKNFIRAKTPARSILVSDAMLAAEMEPGMYTFGGERIEVRPDGYVGKPGAENLAGSVLTLDRAVIHVATYCGIDFETAWSMASVQPARVVGLSKPEEVTVEVGDGEAVRR